MPEGDILVHCGDSTIDGSEWNYKKFLIWFGKQDYKHKVFINGNHEVVVWKNETSEYLVRTHNAGFVTNLHYLENTGVELDGIKFWGSPYTPEFFDWAYMYRRDEGAEKWKDIPANTDVLITHGPPAGILDNVRPCGWRYPLHNAGCFDLLKKIEEIKPKVHCFGHIHSSYGTKKVGDTLFVNASTCNEDYSPVHPPIVIDSETWEVVNYD